MEVEGTGQNGGQEQKLNTTQIKEGKTEEKS